jgi:hypothetical protein
MKRLDFIVYSGSKEWRYGLIIDKYQSHSMRNLILKINTFLREHRWCALKVALEET